jgi:protein-disulfide isomerase
MQRLRLLLRCLPIFVDQPRLIHHQQIVSKTWEAAVPPILFLEIQTLSVHNGIINFMDEIPSTQSVPEIKPANRSTLFWIAGVVIAFIVGMGAGYLIWAMPLQSQLATVQASATAVAQKAGQEQTAVAGDQQDQQQQVKRYDVPIADNPIWGNPNAKITIIEFSDYECPFCRKWHNEVLPQIKEKYGDQVRLVYRDFPLYTIHPDAQSAAEAANCAGEQKRYWDFNEKLFTTSDPLGNQTYEKIAQELKLNLSSFKQCVAEGRYKSEVEADSNYAANLGVRSTPTFFINGLAVVGAQPFEVFQQIIDMELAGKIP